jgi:ribonuclease HIII
MNPVRQLERAERNFWTDGREDAEAARAVVEQVLAAEPFQPILLARAIQIAGHAELKSGFLDRVERELKPRAERLRGRAALLDRLGDENLLPQEAVFDHLAAAVPEADLEEFEPNALGESRARAARRPDAAKALLDALGWERLPDGVGKELKGVVQALIDTADEYVARALLVAPDREGLVLGVKVYGSPGSGVKGLDTIQPEMAKQAEIALSQYAHEQEIGWSLEWPLSFEGSSIGLALVLGGLVACKNVPSDPLLAATGEVDESGLIKGVEGIEAKLRAARDAGIQRVLLPEENRGDAEAMSPEGGPELLYVSRVEQIRSRLNEAGAKSDFSLGGRTAFMKATMRSAGLDVLDDREIDHGRQFKVADAQSTAVVQVFDGAKGTIHVQGSEESSRQLAQQVVEQVCGSPADRARDSRKWKVAAASRRETLEKALLTAGAQEQDAKGQSEQWRYLLQRPGSRAQLTQWTNGTLMLQGEGGAFDESLEIVEGKLEGLANVQAASKSKEPDLSDLPRDVPWAGTDESGKGDYFGPLVSAAVFVDASLAAQLEAIGVRDSKKLSDARVHKMAPEIRRLLGNRFDLTPINPARFNPFYREMKAEGKNMNTLLAWGHARSIEDLIGKGMRPSYVIVDKFADARFMEQKLLADTREAGIELVQVTKAEADVAVAAASILAREAFLNWLDRTSATLGIKLPKGANDSVKKAARQIVATKGQEALGDYAKLFFKTTKEVLGA